MMPELPQHRSIPGAGHPGGSLMDQLLSTGTNKQTTTEDDPMAAFSAPENRPFHQSVVRVSVPGPRAPLPAAGIKSDPDRPLLNVKQVAALMGVSAAWVLAHANGNRRPKLPSVKLGKVVRFQPAKVNEFIQECSR